MIKIKIFFKNSQIKKIIFFKFTLNIFFYQKPCLYYCVQWKIEKTRFLNFLKRFKNNDFMAFFEKIENCMIKLSWKTSKKWFTLNSIDQKSLLLQILCLFQCKNLFLFQLLYFDINNLLKVTVTVTVFDIFLFF